MSASDNTSSVMMGSDVAYDILRIDPVIQVSFARAHKRPRGGFLAGVPCGVQHKIDRHEFVAEIKTVSGAPKCDR